VIGWVDGRPIPRAHLDRRLADLRNGPLAGGLPVPGTSEDRQLARWLTQIILTEALCEATARALDLAPVEGPPLDRLAAVELGSINAAAYNGNPWVRALFQHVTAAVEIPPEWRPRTSPVPSARHAVRHRLFTDRRSAGQAAPDDLEPLGTVELDSLPAALAEAIRRQPYGTLVGPIRDALGWHLAVATPAPPPRAVPNPLVVATPPGNTTPLTPTTPSADTTPSDSADPTPSDVASSPGNVAAPSPGNTAWSAEPRPWGPEQGAAPSPDRRPSRPPEHTALTVPAPERPAHLLDAARRRAFARRLDELRAEKIKLVPGLEHPGDPRQPDNHHKH
jgi:[acyl-carrier-protein] S-malonyltransferase